MSAPVPRPKVSRRSPWPRDAGRHQQRRQPERELLAALGLERALERLAHRTRAVEEIRVSPILRFRVHRAVIIAGGARRGHPSSRRCRASRRRSRRLRARVARGRRRHHGRARRHRRSRARHPHPRSRGRERDARACDVDRRCRPVKRHSVQTRETERREARRAGDGARRVKGKQIRARPSVVCASNYASKMKNYTLARRRARRSLKPLSQPRGDGSKSRVHLTRR